MQYRYAVQICNKDMQYRYATQICNTDHKTEAGGGSDATVCSRYATKNFPCPITPPLVLKMRNNDMQYRYATQICDTDMQQRYAIQICNKDMQ